MDRSDSCRIQQGPQSCKFLQLKHLSCDKRKPAALSTTNQFPRSKYGVQLNAHWVVHRIPEPIVINEGYVFVQEFCYTFSKHKVIVPSTLQYVKKIWNWLPLSGKIDGHWHAHNRISNRSDAPLVTVDEISEGTKSGLLFVKRVYLSRKTPKIFMKVFVWCGSVTFCRWKKVLSCPLQLKVSVLTTH